MWVGSQAVFERPGKPLEIAEFVTPDPRPDEMVVRVDLAGVCGTDAHRLAGDIPAPDVPISIGHEAVGTVVALGSGLATDRAGEPLEVGSRVYWTPGGPCGRCRECTMHIYGCSRMRYPLPADEPNPATYKQYAMLDVIIPVFRVPDEVSNEAVIAFGCALPTAVSAHSRAGAIRSGDTVVVQGSGPVGLAITLLAALSPAQRVIVIGAPRRRLDRASALGATDLISIEETTPAARRERVLDLTDGRGADVVFEAAGRLEAFTEGIPLLARRGRYVVTGLYSGSGTVPFNPVVINNRNLTIVGSLYSSPEMTYRALQLVARHGDRLDFAALVDRRFALEQTEEAIATAVRGEATKAVLDMSLASAAR
jgi:threonine dehydrogenase-like Zn-dependent dehydrogenase